VIEKDGVQLETDENGDILTRPVTGWSIFPVAEIAVLLAVRYVETPEQLETGANKQLQLVLTPQQCLELAETLKRRANAILAGGPEGKTRH
jgi:hypothetical protein